MPAPAVGKDNSNLASQCMAFCQALASRGQISSFTLNVGRVSSKGTLSSWEWIFRWVIDTWKCGSPCEGKRFQVWPMWQRHQIWKRLEDSTHWKNTQQSGSDLTAPKVARNQLRSYSEPLCLGRSPPSSMKLWPGTWIPPLCQSINVPLTWAVSFNAQKKQKKRGGIGNKCKRSTPTGSPRTLHSVNKVQTCMMSCEPL